MTLTELTDWRCSSWSRLEGLDPIGTIGSYAGYLLIELPLPWPRDIGERAELKPLIEAGRARNIRVQAVVPATPGAHRHVIYYAGSAAAPVDEHLGRYEVVVGPADIVTAALDLIESPGTAMMDDRRDVLICSHGRRDRCCGKLGARLAVDAFKREKSAGPVRIWRTSHTGGHRFAPTVLVLPEATGWAYVESRTLARIIDRQGPVSEITSHYRGTAWLDSGPAQTLERAVFEELGWSLLTMPRWSTTDRNTDGDARISTRLMVRFPDGQVQSWAGVVGKRDVLLPNCGEPPLDNFARYGEYHLLSFERL